MFGLSKKKKTEKPDRPKVYATSRGGLYVKVEELEASKVWDDLMNEMQEEMGRRSEPGESTDHPQRKQVGERERTAEKG